MSNWLKEELRDTKSALIFWKGLLFGDFINILVLGLSIWFFLFQHQVDPAKTHEFVLWLLVSLLVPTLTGALKYYSKFDQTLRKFHDVSSTMMLVEKAIGVVQKFSVEHPYKVGLMKSIVDKLPNDFGGVVIGADEKEYIQRLRDLIPSTTECFFATLRGGYEPIYTIGWFFENTKIGEAIVLSADAKKEYLKSVNESRIQNRIRLIILRHQEMGDFQNDNVRNQFLELNKNVELYLVDPVVLRDNLLRQDVRLDGVTINHEGETHFIWEDYAVFDNCIAVKHNGRNSLYLGVQDQIRKMLLPLAMLREQPQLFYMIDKKGLHKHSQHHGWELHQDWEQWKGSQTRDFTKDHKKHHKHYAKQTEHAH